MFLLACFLILLLDVFFTRTFDCSSLHLCNLDLRPTKTCAFVGRTARSNWQLPDWAQRWLEEEKGCKAAAKQIQEIPGQSKASDCRYKPVVLLLVGNLSIVYTSQGLTKEFYFGTTPSYRIVVFLKGLNGRVFLWGTIYCPSGLQNRRLKELSGLAACLRSCLRLSAYGFSAEAEL